MTQFIQLRLWEDCSNNCTFCSLRDTERHHSDEELRRRLNVVCDFVDKLDSNIRLGLIGGELFDGSRPIWVGWYNLIRHINALKPERLFLTATLIGDQRLLLSIIEFLEVPLTICTSWDSKGRFHSEEDEASWCYNIEKLHDLNVSVACTMILSEENLSSDAVFPEWLSVNFCEPLSTCKHLMDFKETYHDDLIANVSGLTLPSRTTALNWFKTHIQYAKIYSNYNNTHSDSVYEFVDGELTCTINHRLYLWTRPCGHQHMAQCYGNSDKCMQCDCIRVLDSWAGDKDV